MMGMGLIVGLKDGIAETRGGVAWDARSFLVLHGGEKFVGKNVSNCAPKRE